MADFHPIFKAYDVRGVVPEQFDADMAHSIGSAFAAFVLSRDPDAEAVAVGRDMRDSGVAMAAAFASGVCEQGLNVVDIGLASTDLLYFVSGSRRMAGAMFTASHNPAQYNGIKFCLAGATPVGEESGLMEVRDMATSGVPPTHRRGTISHQNFLAAFADHVRTFVDLDVIHGVKIVADTANGMGGLVVPAVFDSMDVDLEVLFGELDGSFPNHPADPLQAENQQDLMRRVVQVGADIGLAFDGDADRVFLVDELGVGLSGSTTTAILADAILRRKGPGKIVHNLICSKAVPEVIREAGGEPIRTRVGHSFIKQVMAETSALFGGEHSAHYYFADNYRADSGLIAAILVIEQMCVRGIKLSELRRPFERYAASGEINTRVSDSAAVIEAVSAAYAKFDQDRLDGLTVDAGDWWFNLRASNTEPLLRLNLEARTAEEVELRVQEVQRHLI